MSDRSNPLGVSGMLGPPSMSPPRMGLTDYERELQPFFQEAKEERSLGARVMKPIEKIFDFLQRGQYVSANIVGEIQDAMDQNPDTEVDFAKAIFDGITGREKGSYVDVLNRANIGQSKVGFFRNAPEGTRRSEMKWSNVLGFIGDILLDPTTYMSFGLLPGAVSATKGATRAANEFAEDSVRMMLKKLADDPKMLAQIAPGKATMIEGLSTGSRKLIKEVMGRSDDLGRVLDTTYRAARDKALVSTQGQLAEEMTQGIARYGVEGLEDLRARLSAGAYRDSGKHSARVLGKQFMERDANMIDRGWERFKNIMRPKPEKGDLRSAIWGKMNRGVIGEIRQMFGFRNPYQTYIRSLEKEANQSVTRLANQEMARALEPLSKLSGDQLQQTVEYFAAKQDAVRLVPEKGSSIMAGIGTPAAEGIEGAAWDVRSVLDDWIKKETTWASEIGEDAAKYNDWYLPSQWRESLDGNTNVRQGAKYTINQRVDQEVNKLRFIFGFSDEKARRIVQGNSSNLVMDIRELVAGRAMVHAKAKARHDIIQQFKEFGINMADVADPAAKGLVEGAAKLDLNQIGLNSINHKAFNDPEKGLQYVFDDDVADIIRRTLEVTGEKKNPFARGMAAYQNWWKSIVTMTTGFHARNFSSNTTTQFLRHGMRAFDFQDIRRSIAATAYALRKSNPQKFLDELGIDEGWIKKALNESVGQYKVRELADEALERGVISEATMAYDAKELVEKMRGKPPIGKGAIRDMSRDVGSFLENVPRFQSFLIDYSDLATKELAEGSTRDVAEKTTLDWAGREAKKWFLDYTDLTEFEQKWMKNVVPFYTWMRKNLANQINGVALYPDLYSVLPKIENLVELEDPDYDPALIPDWMREEGMFPVAKMGDSLRMFRPDFAHMDLNLIPFKWTEGKLFPEYTPQELKDELINATSPLVRRFANWMMQSENPYNFFYKEEMGPRSEAPHAVRLIASRPGVLPILDGLLRKMGYEDGAGVNERNGRIQIDSNLVVLLEDFVPVLRQMEFLFYLPQMVPSLKNGLDSVIKNASAQNKYEDTDMALQQLSFWLGIKSSEVDLSNERERMGWDLYNESTQALQEQRREQPGYQVRSNESRNRTLNTIRRLGG